MPKETLPLTERWIDRQIESVSDAQLATAYERIFGNEMACRGLILALSELCELATDNDDSEMADACQLVMRGVALAHLGHGVKAP